MTFVGNFVGNFVGEDFMPQGGWGKAVVGKCVFVYWASDHQWYQVPILYMSILNMIIGCACVCLCERQWLECVCLFIFKQMCLFIFKRVFVYF